MNKKLHKKDLLTFSLPDIQTMTNYFGINHRLSTSKVIDQLAEQIILDQRRKAEMPYQEEQTELPAPSHAKIMEYETKVSFGKGSIDPNTLDLSDILPYVKEDFIEMLKFCSAGPLKMLRIKPESTLYNLSTELPRPLPEKKIWLFLDRKDINKKVLDFYRREMDYNFLTNWTVKKDLNLIQMSDIQTVLRLFCDERVNVNLKQYIAYAFGIKKKQPNFFFRQRTW